MSRKGSKKEKKMVGLRTFGGLADFENFWLGYDRFNRQFTREVLPYAEVNYPRYNIAKEADNYTIEVGLPGWNKKDLEVVLKENILTIEGKKQETSSEYIHRGVSGKAFKRTFTLQEDLIVQDVRFENGMLEILIMTIVPDERKPKTFEIKG
jgi:molecular chaperone IbpA|tara:strand:- start:284 stop:739 length:456 start_codon:yes stop_codon:yes gene_type:complete